MEVKIASNYQEVSRRAASRVAEEIIKRKEPVLGLPTGETPKRTYYILGQYCDAGIVDYSRVTTFNLDEYYPIKPDAPKSFHHYMEEEFFREVNIDLEKTNIPDGDLPSEEVKAYCEQYEKKIKKAGGIDLMVIGIGENGHIGFNEPGADFDTCTRLVDLKDRTIERNFQEPQSAPDQAITMGIKTIMASSSIILLASGFQKSDAIETAVTGKVKESCPASILQLHPDTTFILDEEAGSNL